MHSRKPPHAGKPADSKDTRTTSPDPKQTGKSFDHYRTLIDYHKAYIHPYEDALLDAWSTLRSDITRMKALKPVPEDALAQAEEELAELKNQMTAAGILFSD